MENTKRKKILVVDDDKTICFTLKEILEKEGHEVTVANCPSEAQVIMVMDQFDALFVDMCMPELSGENLIRNVINLEEQYKNKIILMTGDVHGIEKIRRLENEIGIKKVLLKPFSIDELLITLDDIFVEKEEEDD